MSEHTAADWTTAVERALEARDVGAVPNLLVLMALDGYGHEAESLRRTLLRASEGVHISTLDPFGGVRDRSNAGSAERGSGV